MTIPGSAAAPPKRKDPLPEGMIPIFIDGQLFMKSKKEALHIASTILALVSGTENG